VDPHHPCRVPRAEGGAEVCLSVQHRFADRRSGIVVEPAEPVLGGRVHARGGYRQAASEYGARDLSEGEKTLGYYVFEDAKFGGVLHIPYTDGDGSSQGDWNLKLAIK
jgi:hypothetical protein